MDKNLFNYPWFKNWPDNLPKTINYENKKPLEYIQQLARKNPNRVAIITPNSSITYSEFYSKIEKLSFGLNRLGLGKDDRVGIALINCEEFAIAFYAILNIGAIAVLIDPTDTIPTFQRKVSETEPEAIITHDFLFKEHEKVLNEKIAILVRSKAYYTTETFFERIYTSFNMLKISFLGSDRATIFFDELLNSKISFWGSESKTHLDDTACILYSVGSKGIRFSHRDLTIGAQQVAHWTNLIKKDRILSIFPLTKSFGLSFCLNLPLTMGASTILMPPHNIKQVLKVITQEKPTIFIGTSGIYEKLFNYSQLHQYDLSSLKYSFTIDKLTYDIRRKFKQKTTCRLIEAYALTETSTIQCSNLLEKEKLGSIGIPLPDVEMKIVDLDNYTKELLPNEIGEIAIKSPSLMKGYWDPKESFRKLHKDWFLTGDVGKMDDDGFFYIYNKKWDIIKTDVGMIFPKEIETILDQHPAVLESVIVGIKHNDTTYLVAAVKLKDLQIRAEDLIEYCIQKLENYKVPDFICFVEELIRAENGRRDRQKIKAALRSELKLGLNNVLTEKFTES